MRKNAVARFSRPSPPSLVNQPVFLPFLYQTRSITKFLERQSLVEVKPQPARGRDATPSTSMYSPRETVNERKPVLPKPQTRTVRPPKKGLTDGTITSDEGAIFDRLFNEIALRTGGVRPSPKNLPKRKTVGYVPFEQDEPVDPNTLEAPERTPDEVDKARALLSTYPVPLRRKAALANRVFDVYNEMHPPELIKPRGKPEKFEPTVEEPVDVKVNPTDDPSPQTPESLSQELPILGSEKRAYIPTANDEPQKLEEALSISLAPDLKPSAITIQPAKQDLVNPESVTSPTPAVRRTKKRKSPQKRVTKEPAVTVTHPPRPATAAELSSAFAEKQLLLDEAAYVSRDAIFGALKKHVYPLISISPKENTSPLAMAIFPKLILYAQALVFRCYGTRPPSIILPKLRNFAKPDPTSQEPKLTGALHYVLASSPAIYDLLLRYTGGLVAVQLGTEEQRSFLARFEAGRKRIQETMAESGSETLESSALDLGTDPPRFPQPWASWPQVEQLLHDMDKDGISPTSQSSPSTPSDDPPSTPSTLIVLPPTNPTPDLLTTLDQILAQAKSHGSKPVITSQARRSYTRVLRWRERTGRICGRDAITDLVGQPGCMVVDVEAQLRAGNGAAEGLAARAGRGEVKGERWSRSSQEETGKRVQERVQAQVEKRVDEMFALGEAVEEGEDDDEYRLVGGVLA